MSIETAPAPAATETCRNAACDYLRSVTMMRDNRQQTLEAEKSISKLSRWGRAAAAYMPGCALALPMSSEEIADCESELAVYEALVARGENCNRVCIVREAQNEYIKRGLIGGTVIEEKV